MWAEEQAPHVCPSSLCQTTTTSRGGRFEKRGFTVLTMPAASLRLCKTLQGGGGGGSNIGLQHACSQTCHVVSDTVGGGARCAKRRARYRPSFPFDPPFGHLCRTSARVRPSSANAPQQLAGGGPPTQSLHTLLMPTEPRAAIQQPSAHLDLTAHAARRPNRTQQTNRTAANKNTNESDWD